MFIKVYTIELIKHKNDRPHGIVSINVDMNISIIFSFISLIGYNIVNFCNIIIFVCSIQITNI